MKLICRNTKLQFRTPPQRAVIYITNHHTGARYSAPEDPPLGTQLDCKRENFRMSDSRSLVGLAIVAFTTIGITSRALAFPDQYSPTNMHDATVGQPWTPDPVTYIGPPQLACCWYQCTFATGDGQQIPGGTGGALANGQVPKTIKTNGTFTFSQPGTQAITLDGDLITQRFDPIRKKWEAPLPYSGIKGTGPSCHFDFTVNVNPQQ
jgi:hypothetical protein